MLQEPTFSEQTSHTELNLICAQVLSFLYKHVSYVWLFSMLAPTVSRSFTCYTGLIGHVLTRLLLQLSEWIIILGIGVGMGGAKKVFQVHLQDILDLT